LLPFSISNLYLTILLSIVICMFALLTMYLFEILKSIYSKSNVGLEQLLKGNKSCKIKEFNILNSIVIICV